MKIMFLCGSLEPGCDGVGDYIRRLAIELIKQDINVAALALNDSYVNQEIGCSEFVEHFEIHILRIPSRWKQKKRLACAKDWIARINPEWLSLQFVPFSFDDKGLPFKLAKELQKIGIYRKWHVMFHELWVGMDDASPVKQIFWGYLQRRLIISLLKLLKPMVIHTQSALYQIQLEKIGFKVRQLLLFGNVPLKTDNYQSRNISFNKMAKSDISIVIFGGIHLGSPFEEFSKEIGDIGKTNKWLITFKFIGRCGNEQEKLISVLAKGGFKVQVFGEQSTEAISKLFLESCFGVTTTPLHLVDKSGAVAAMCEHGLPVLCVARKWNPSNISNFKAANNIWEYKQGNLEGFFSMNYNRAITNRISEVTNELLECLSKND